MFRNLFTHSKVSGIVGALLTLAAGLYTATSSYTSVLLRQSYDLLFSVRPSIPLQDEVVIIYLDEESYRDLDQYENMAWDRQLHADLIRRLHADGARVIVFDILFSGDLDADGTLALKEAIQAHGNVVIGAEYLPTPEGLGYTIYYPVDSLRESAQIGLVQLTIDPDYGIRQHWPNALETPDHLFSLPWTTAKLVQAPITQNPKSYTQEKWINYYGPPNSIPSVSYRLAYREDGLPKGFFKDKIVLIGQGPGLVGFGGDSKDEFITPFTQRTGLFSGGVEIHATTLLNYLRGDWLIRMPDLPFLLLLVTLGVLAGYGLTLLQPHWAALLTLACVILFAGMVYGAFSMFRLWFPWLCVIAIQLPVALGWSILSNSVRTLLQTERLHQSLELHLSVARTKQILKRPDLLKPGAERQIVTILFSDIANFSKITARLNPEDLFHSLNRYFEVAIGCIHETDGTVIKLIGDAIFAVWNAPFPQADHQLKACQAAILLKDRLKEFDSQSQSLPFKTRVGLHTCEAFIGNVGSSKRFDYTAIGDGINLASRLEGLNKYLGTEQLLTRDTQRVVENHITSRLVGHFKFKGFDRIVEVHEILGAASEQANSQQWRDAFEQALYHYQRRAFDPAEAGFKETLKHHPQDGPSLFYLDQICQWRETPPPDDWTGEAVIREK